MINVRINAQSRTISSHIVCLNIIDNDQVEVKWTKSVTENFESYTLFFSDDGTTFTELLTLPNVEDTTYLHTGINALQSSKYYYVKVNGSLNDKSPIAKTLFIQGIDVNSNGYEADLFWSTFADTLHRNMGDYKVYNDYPDGNWHLVGTTEQNEMRHIKVITCNDSIRFKVEINYGDCISNSTQVKGLFQDIILPDKPVLDSVSVTPGGQTVIGWTQSDSMDVVGNIIYRYDGTKWLPIDSVWGYDTQFYIDTVKDPCIENYKYAISAFDSCGNKSPFTDQTAQRPIFLYNIHYSVCDLKDTLRWIVYEHPKIPIETYEIWRSQNNGAYTLINTVNPQQGMDELTYVDDDIDPGALYEYFVRAKMDTITSSSCRKTVQTFSYKIPQFVNTVTADVLADNTVTLVIDGDMTVNKCVWDVWRYGPAQPDTTHIAQVTKPNQNTSPFNVSDGDVNASINPLFYYTTVIDSCGKERHKSENFKTIWLQGNTQDNINHLFWTASQGWTDGVEKYYIFRTVPGVEPTAPIDSVDGNTLQYQEPAPTSGVADGRTIYFVQALKKPVAGERITSTSNRIPLYKAATLYFANAFRPDGVNNEFKPIFDFFGGLNYLFRIYDRWGKIIFETNDINKGWDGTFNNEPVEKGTYVYVITYRSVNGKNISHKGTVTLIR
jgi:gliding motility-associated-like protein